MHTQIGEFNKISERSRHFEGIFHCILHDHRESCQAIFCELGRRRPFVQETFLSQQKTGIRSVEIRIDLMISCLDHTNAALTAELQGLDRTRSVGGYDEEPRGWVFCRQLSKDLNGKIDTLVGLHAPAENEHAMVGGIPQSFA